MTNLIRSDFVLTKKYIIVLLATCLIFPFAMDFDVRPGSGDVTGTMVLLITTVYFGYFCLQYLMAKESEFHGAVALLGASPYTRTQLVISKYLFALLLCACSFGLYWLETLWAPALRGVTPLGTAAVFCMGVALPTGVYIPLVYRFGYDKTRLLAFAVIVLTPFLVAQLGHSTDVFQFLQLPAPVLTGVFWAAGAAVLAVSMVLSVHFFSRAELA